MKFNGIAALVICAFTSQVKAASFNVSPRGVGCGLGTTINCTPTPGGSCKGNFSPAQATVIVTGAQGNCYLSLYTGFNQSGSITERLNTDTVGTCVTTPSANWKSYGLFCDD